MFKGINSMEVIKIAAKASKISSPIKTFAIINTDTKIATVIP